MRGLRLNISRQAQIDLAGIFEYIAEHDPIAASLFLDDITNYIERMAGLGLIGVKRALIPGLRMFAYRERCIYFLVNKNELTVLRILHGRQMVAPSAFTESDTD